MSRVSKHGHVWGGVCYHQSGQQRCRGIHTYIESKRKDGRELISQKRCYFILPFSPELHYILISRRRGYKLYGQWFQEGQIKILRIPISDIISDIVSANYVSAAIPVSRSPFPVSRYCSWLWCYCEVWMGCRGEGEIFLILHSWMVVQWNWADSDSVFVASSGADSHLHKYAAAIGHELTLCRLTYIYRPTRLISY